MKLGLVCISELLRQKSPELAFKTMTRTQFLKKKREESILILSQRIAHNLTVTIETIRHCKKVGIKHYRLSCKLFPLITDPTLHLSVDSLPNHPTIIQRLSEIGRVAKELGIRISIHPDQFVVLGSDSDDVCAKSIVELNFHAWVLDACGLPQNYECPINIHPSLSKFESAEVFVKKFVLNFFQCDMGVRNRLVIENEDKGFWNCNNLHEYFYSHMRQTYNFHFPLTLDNLHDKCNPSIDSNGNIIPYEKHFMKFYSTWPVEPVFHWSESDDNTLKHAKTVKTPPVDLGLDCIYEMEYKNKDKGFAHLLPNYKLNFL
jgi:UV DNA damage endonuclease